MRQVRKQYSKRNEEKKMQWILAGEDQKLAFEKELNPNELEIELMRYQKVFGTEFGIKELLMLEDIRCKAMIAEAVSDMPEYLMDQIGRMRNSHEVSTIAGALDDLGESLSRIADEM